MSESGEVVAKYDYTPFGKLVNTFNNPNSAFRNPFLFSSEYFDEETGLVYYNYRYYNPELGRWMSCDPIGEEGGLNLYGMVNNDILNLSDTNGLKPIHVNKKELDEFKECLDKVKSRIEDGVLLHKAYGGDDEAMQKLILKYAWKGIEKLIDKAGAKMGYPGFVLKAAKSVIKDGTVVGYRIAQFVQDVRSLLDVKLKIQTIQLDDLNGTGPHNVHWVDEQPVGIHKVHPWLYNYKGGNIAFVPVEEDEFKIAIPKKGEVWLKLVAEENWIGSSVFFWRKVR